MRLALLHKQIEKKRFKPHPRSAPARIVTMPNTTPWNISNVLCLMSRRQEGSSAKNPAIDETMENTKTMHEIFSEDATRNIVAFSALLRRVHARLLAEGFDIENWQIVEKSSRLVKKNV